MSLETTAMCWLYLAVFMVVAGCLRPVRDKCKNDDVTMCEKKYYSTLDFKQKDDINDNSPQFSRCCHSEW